MSQDNSTKNRGTHGDSSFMLGGIPSSSENLPASAVGSVNKSVYDHSPYYYIQQDITDPTPYEGDSPWRYDECECPICGQGFRKDEGLLSLTHKDMKHEILIHESCVWDAALSAPNPEHAILNFLEDIGFEIEDIEPIERE